MVKQSLLVATNNPGKMREVSAILEGVPLRLVAPAELGL